MSAVLNTPPKPVIPPQEEMLPHVVSHPREEDFKAGGLRDFFVYRDLGITGVTGGKHGAYVARAVREMKFEQGRHVHITDFQFIYILKGMVKFWYDGIGEVDCPPGTSVFEAPGRAHELTYASEGCEILQISSPADYETVALGLAP
ncbi:MAG: cupin domain-containing protein [Lautropia sp.]